MIFGFDNAMEEELAYPEATDEFYTLRPITDELQRHWNRQTTKTRYKRGQEVQERDDVKYFEHLYDHLFAGWRGAIYLTVEEARAETTSECNLENKLKFVSTQPDRTLWALREGQTMGDRLAAKTQAQRESFRQARGVPATAGVSGPELPQV